MKHKYIIYSKNRDIGNTNHYRVKITPSFRNITSIKLVYFSGFNSSDLAVAGSTIECFPCTPAAGSVPLSSLQSQGIGPVIDDGVSVFTLTGGTTGQILTSDATGLPSWLDRTPLYPDRVVVLAQGNGTATTITEAISQANALVPTVNNRVIIAIAPGTYIADNSAGPILLPDFTTIKSIGTEINSSSRIQFNDVLQDGFLTGNQSNMIGLFFLPCNYAIIPSVSTGGIRIYNCTFAGCGGLNIINSIEFVFIDNCYFLNSPSYAIINEATNIYLIINDPIFRAITSPFSPTAHGILTRNSTLTEVNTIRADSISELFVAEDNSVINITGGYALNVNETIVQRNSSIVYATALNIRETVVGILNSVDIQDNAMLVFNNGTLDNSLVSITPPAIMYRNAFSLPDRTYHINGSLILQDGTVNFPVSSLNHDSISPSIDGEHLMTINGITNWGYPAFYSCFKSGSQNIISDDVIIWDVVKNNNTIGGTSITQNAAFTEFYIPSGTWKVELSSVYTRLTTTINSDIEVFIQDFTAGAVNLFSRLQAGINGVTFPVNIITDINLIIPLTTIRVFFNFNGGTGVFGNGPDTSYISFTKINN